MLRGAVDNPERQARFAAVYALMAAISVPINWMAIRWWRTIHPRVITPAKVDLDPRMWISVLFCFATMLILVAVLMRLRMHLEKTHELVMYLQEKVQEENL